MNRHRITLTVETDRAALIDQLRFLVDAVYVDAHFEIVIDDLGNDEAEPDAEPDAGIEHDDINGHWAHAGGTPPQDHEANPWRHTLHRGHHSDDHAAQFIWGTCRHCQHDVYWVDKEPAW